MNATVNQPTSRSLAASQLADVRGFVFDVATGELVEVV